jgi:hypothetical protein
MVNVRQRVDSQISRDALASGLRWKAFPAARTGASALRLMGQ